MSEVESNTHKTPLRVYVLMNMLLLFAAWNLLRAGAALAWRAALLEFSGTAAFWEVLLGGIIWSLAGIFLLWGVLKQRHWAKRAVTIAAAAYLLWYWVERLAQQAARPNARFAVIVNLILFSFILFATNSLSREAYEQNTQTSKVE